MNDEIDRGLALRYRVAALISGVLACAGVTGAGAHLSLGDTFLATPWVVFSVAAFVWVRAYAMRAAHELCRGVDKAHQFHYDVPGAGHYGIFSGRRWREMAYPRVREFIGRYEAAPVAAPVSPAARPRARAQSRAARAA